MVQHLAPADVCDSSFFFTVLAAFAILQLRASLVRRPANELLLPYPSIKLCYYNHAYFTEKVVSTDVVSTFRFVAAQVSPRKRNCAPMVCTGGDVISRQES